MADAVESFIRSRAEGKHRDAVDSFLDELMAAPRDTVPGQGQPVPDISDQTDPTMQRFIENQDPVGGRVANVGSEERRGGKAWVSKCRSRWAPVPLKKKQK